MLAPGTLKGDIDGGPLREAIRMIDGAHSPLRYRTTTGSPRGGLSRVRPDTARVPVPSAGLGRWHAPPAGGNNRQAQMCCSRSVSPNTRRPSRKPYPTPISENSPCSPSRIPRPALWLATPTCALWCAMPSVSESWAPNGFQQLQCLCLGFGPRCVHIEGFGRGKSHPAGRAESCRHSGE